MPEDTDRLAKLEARLQKLEDHHALAQILSAFGPVIEACTPEEISEFYLEDGEYRTDIPGAPPAKGRAAIGALFAAPMHQNAVATGAGHLTGPPHIVVEGDAAQAFCHTMLCLRSEAGWMIARVASNHFHFVRTLNGWRIKSRINRQLGAEEARALFRDAPKGLPWTA